MITFTTKPGSVFTGEGNDVAVDNFLAGYRRWCSAAVTTSTSRVLARTWCSRPGGPCVVPGLRGTGRSARLDDAANDGLAGADQNIHSDVEGIIGGRGPDVLIGGDFGDTSDDSAGTTLLFGLGGTTCSPGGPGRRRRRDVRRDRRRHRHVRRPHRPVAAWLDDSAFDGSPNDNVHDDIENITGTNAGDVPTGSAANNVINDIWPATT